MTSLPDRIEKLPRQVEMLSRDCTAKLAAFALPALPPALDGLIQHLRDNQYTVLVLGELKRGKSSFINAVIGRPLLPTAVAVATSQVFRVSRAEEHACRLRFEDGSSQPIGDEDLARYGSQIFADEEGAAPEAKDIIRWIEVDVPIKFLPDGISLLDTPGLGSLYAAHGRITSRFVPLSDGVIYVLDSDTPAVEDDMKYIASVLEKTSNLFFIQTRIDAYDRDHWQTVHKRNQEILRERFANRLADPRIWPISNTNLMKAAETGDTDYLRVSRFSQLSQALQAFLFRVGGLTLGAQATGILLEHHEEATRILMRQLANLQEESKERAEANRRAVGEWQETFQSTWGERGDKRVAVSRTLRDLTMQARGEFLQALQPGGTIETEIERDIVATTSLNEVKTLGQTINDRLVGRAGELWQRITRDAQSTVTQELVPLFEEARTLSFAGVGSPGDIAGGSGPEISAKDGWYERFRGGRMDMMILGGTTTALTQALLATAVLTGPLGLAVATIASVGAAIFGLFRGGRQVKERQHKQGQEELRRHVAKVLTAIRQHFFGVRIGQKSVVDSFFDALDESANAEVSALIERKTEEAKAQLHQLQEDARLDQKSRATAIAEVQDKLRQWQELGRSVGALAEEVDAIDRDLAAQAAG